MFSIQKNRFSQLSTWHMSGRGRCCLPPSLRLLPDTLRNSYRRVHTFAHVMDDPTSSSPYGHLHSQAKKVIFNVNRYFLEEKANGAPILPPSKALARTAMATKTSERTVRRICSSINQSLHKEAAPETPTFTSPKKKNRAEPVTGFDDFDGWRYM